MKQLFHRYLICLLLCQGLTGLAQSGKGPAPLMQSDQLMAKGGGNGIFIFISEKPLPTGSSYTIERRGLQESSFSQIAVVQVPPDQASFATRLREMRTTNPFPEEIKEKKVALAWNAVLHSPDSAKYYITSPQLQVAAGMTWFDAKAGKGISYIYRVSMIDKARGSRWEKTTSPVSYPEKLIYPTLSFSGYTFSWPGQCTINWKARSAVNAASFILMRSDASQRAFHPVPALIIRSVRGDSTFVSTIDTTAVAGKTFSYQLIAADPFGNIGNIAAAQRVITYDLRRVPLPQNLLTNTVDSAVDHGIRISWTVKEPEFVFKTRIYRAENERGPYRLYTELPVTVNLFIDQRIEPAKFYYYHLTLVGLMGEESASTINFPGVYYSTLPAGIPSVLKYQPLANGVSLRFVSNDREVTGYRVYRCQGFRGVLQQISPFIPAPVAGEVIQFTDSSSGLSGKQTYGYAIRAENSSHLLSGFSDTVYARPLIVTIPPAPVNVAVIHTGVSNKIFWQDMRMQEPIVVGYNIFRATPHASGFQQINRGLIPASSNSYLDSLTDKNSDYTYYVQSVDGFGGLSRGSSVTGGTASAQAHETIPSPQGLSGYITAIGVQLEWMPMNLPSLNAFRLYRYRRGETALLLTTVNKQSNLQYLDKTIEGGSLYFYYLVAVDDAGSTSDKGNEVSIRAEK